MNKSKNKLRKVSNRRILNKIINRMSDEQASQNYFDRKIINAINILKDLIIIFCIGGWTIFLLPFIEEFGSGDIIKFGDESMIFPFDDPMEIEEMREYLTPEEYEKFLIQAERALELEKSNRKLKEDLNTLSNIGLWIGISSFICLIVIIASLLLRLDRMIIKVITITAKCVKYCNRLFDT